MVVLQKGHDYYIGIDALEYDEEVTGFFLPVALGLLLFILLRSSLVISFPVGVGVSPLLDPAPPLPLEGELLVIDEATDGVREPRLKESLLCNEIVKL